METIVFLFCACLTACMMMILMGFKWWMEMAGVLPCPPDPTMMEPVRKDMPLLKSASCNEPVAVRTQQYNKELM